MKITKKSDLVVRNNKLINANIKLTSKEYDLVRTFMKNIKRSDSDFWTFTVMASDVGIETKRGKDTVRSISRKPVEIELGKDGLVAIPFFTYFKYQNGAFEGRFNNDLKEMLLEIKGNFTKTFEKYILPMDSIYAKRIYEMLYENKSIGYRKFRLNDLYETLKIPKSMRNYANFKKYVLLVTIREINKHTDIYIPIDTENLKDESWIKLQCGIKRGVTHLNFEFQNKSTASAPATKSQEPKEISAPSQTKTELLEKRFEELANNLSLLNYLDLPAEFEINEIDVELTKEFHKYISKQLFVFFQYCRDNNKNYKNLATSFKRHIRGAYKNNLDFFVTKEYLNRKEYENKLNEIKQIKEMEIYLEKHNNTNFEMILNDEKEQIFVINNKLFVSFEGNLLAINDKENMLKVVAYLKNI